MYVSVALYCYHYSIQRAGASKIHIGRLPYINWHLEASEEHPNENSY